MQLPQVLFRGIETIYLWCCVTTVPTAADSISPHETSHVDAYPDLETIFCVITRMICRELFVSFQLFWKYHKRTQRKDI